MKASITDFTASLKDNSAEHAYSQASKREYGIPLYDGEYLRSMTADELQVVKKEWAECWIRGAGVVIIQGFYADNSIVDEMSGIMIGLLEKEKREKKLIGDHFGEQGSNHRVWNVLEKAAIEDPGVFIHYYKNPLLDGVAEAWLGPNYQVTAQVNLVPPGGSAPQTPHRDYHLGFQETSVVERFPLHAQTMSAMLTLQGAVAHVEMPVESGPTRLLPYSQQYDLGYQLYCQDDFKAYFNKHAKQLPLSKGDALFFNPALMHGAGSNTSSNINRLANLLQISSSFGIPMEMVDHDRIQLACIDALQKVQLSWEECHTITTVMSDSYPFPTNLDRDTPVASLTPTSSRLILLQALDQGWEKPLLKEKLNDYRWRRSTV